MKIKLLGAAALSLLFVATSCDNEIVEKANVKNDNSIKFQTVLGKQTKATEMDLAGLQGAAKDAGTAIPVKAFATGKNIAFNTFGLYWNNTNWVYAESGSEITQPGYIIDYYAWYPNPSPLTETSHGITNAFSVSTDGKGTFGYTVLSTSALQEDLIAAFKSTADENVSLDFNHLLSQVNFAIQGVENVKIEITGIKVNDVMSVNTYTFNTNKWGDTPTTAVTYDYSAFVNGTETAPTDYTTNGTAAQTILHMGNNGNEHSRNNALMLMPQQFKDGDKANFSFNYKLKDMNGNSLGEGSSFANLSGLNTNWEMGIRYIYVIDFSSYVVGGPIKFTVKVNPWEDNKDGDGKEDPIEVPTKTKANAITIDATYVSTNNNMKGAIEAAISTHSGSKASFNTLKEFPITVSEDLDATLAFDLANNYANFEIGDKIVITFNGSYDSYLDTKPTSIGDEWNYVAASNVVTLTKRSNVAPTVNATAATKEAIEVAIAAQLLVKTNTGTSYYKVFPITVTGKIGTNINDLAIIDVVPKFIQGDKITITFKDEISVTSTNISLADETIWGPTSYNNNTITYTKK